MSDLKVSVVYSDPFGGWKYLEKGLNKRLPIEDIKWSVSLVDVECKNLKHLVFENAANVPPATKLIGEWHSEPYLHLYVALCKDKKTYDTTVKDSIQKWLEDHEKDEWLIVYLSRPTDPNRKVTFFNVFHYMRKDFNIVRNQERVIQIKVSGKDAKEDDEGWEKLMAKLKEGIARHGQETMEKHIQEIRKLDAERVHPGWNYCKFFAIKEGLAFMYETFQMYEEALMQYDELEALFSAEMEKNNKLYGTRGFGGTDPGDDSGSLLDPTKKAYRKLILENKITEFDFLQYTFARQTQLLFERDLTVNVAERGTKFIKMFLKELQKHEFPRLFMLAWAFGAYADLAEACKAYGIKQSIPSVGSSAPSRPVEKLESEKNASIVRTASNTNLMGIPTTAASTATATANGTGQIQPNMIPTTSSGSNIPSIPTATSTVGKRNRQKKDKKQLSILLADIYFNAVISLHDIGVHYGFLPKDSDVFYFGPESHKPLDVKPLTPEQLKVLPTSIRDQPPEQPQLPQQSSPQLPQQLPPQQLQQNHNIRDSDDYLEASDSDLEQQTDPAKKSNPENPEQQVSKTENTTAPTQVENDVKSEPAEKSEKKSEEKPEEKKLEEKKSEEKPEEKKPNEEDDIGEDGEISVEEFLGELEKTNTKKSGSTTPSTSQKDSIPEEITRTVNNYSVSHPSLFTALSQGQVSAFDKLYLSVVKKATRCFRECHRQRSIAWLQCKLADMHFWRGQYVECAKILKEQLKVFSHVHQNFLGNPSDTPDEAWPPLMAAALHKMCECYRKRNQQVDYVAMLLELLHNEENVPIDLRKFYFSDLIRVVRSENLEKKLAKEALNALAKVIVVAPPHHLQFLLDEHVVIECLLNSCSPLDLEIDSLSLQFVMEEDLESVTLASEPTTRKMVLETKNVLLQPNVTQKVRLELQPSVVGTFVLDKLWISVGKLMLQQSILHAIWEREFSVTISPSKSTLQFSVIVPPSLILQQTQYLLIHIDTSSDTVRKGALVIRAPRGLFKVPPPVVPTNIKEDDINSGYSGKDDDENKETTIQILRTIDPNSGPVPFPAKFSLTQKGVHISLPDCEKNEQLDFSLPLTADGITQKTHEVTFSVDYQKITQESFTVPRTLDLQFQHPFHVEHNVIPVNTYNLANNNDNNTNISFIHVHLTNVCAGPVEILDYKMDLKGCSDLHKVLSDFNEEIRNSIISPKEAVSLLFEIESSVLQVKTLSSAVPLTSITGTTTTATATTNIGTNGTVNSPANISKKLPSAATPQLVISYKFLSAEQQTKNKHNNNYNNNNNNINNNINGTDLTATSTTLSPLLHLHSDIIGRVLTFTHKLRVARVRPDFIVKCEHPATAYRGQRVKFTWNVIRENIEGDGHQGEETELQNKNSQSEKFSIKVDKALWIIASKGSGSFDLERGGTKRFAKIECTLIPLACGLLPPPTLCLDSVIPARVSDCTSKEDTVTVFPPGLVNSRCEKIEISSQKKEFWFSILDQQN